MQVELKLRVMQHLILCIILHAASTEFLEANSGSQVGVDIGLHATPGSFLPLRAPANPLHQDRRMNDASSGGLPITIERRCNRSKAHTQRPRSCLWKLSR